MSDPPIRPLGDGGTFPVRVDPEGRVFDEHGRQVTSLDPAGVLAGIADLDAGRTVAIEEVMVRLGLAWPPEPPAMNDPDFAEHFARQIKLPPPMTVRLGHVDPHHFAIVAELWEPDGRWGASETFSYESARRLVEIDRDYHLRVGERLLLALYRAWSKPVYAPTVDWRPDAMIAEDWHA